jgi:hypothetical protein
MLNTNTVPIFKNTEILFFKCIYDTCNKKWTARRPMLSKKANAAFSKNNLLNFFFYFNSLSIAW